MSDAAQFVYDVNFRANTEELVDAVNSVRSQLDRKPVAMAVKADVGTRLADIENFAKEIGVATTNLNKITVQYQEFFDMTEGKKISIPVKEVISFTDELGKTITQTKTLNEKQVAMFRNLGNFYQRLGTTFAEHNVGKEVQEINKQISDMDKRAEKADMSAEKLLVRLEKMSGPAAEKTRQLAQKMSELVKEYNKLRQSGDLSGAQAKFNEIEELQKDVDLATESMKRGAQELQGFGSTMQRAMKQSIAYGLAMRGVRIAQEKFNEAIRYVIDLDTEMTKIRVLQVEGAKTQEQIDKLADSYNRLGTEMAANTLEVAKGSVEWMRQGKTLQETQALLRSTIMLAKLGDMTTEDATEKLTATLNGYKMEAKDAISVVDKLIEVDNIAATSVKELTTALQYSAAIAKETGVSFEQLVSYIGVISSTTRQNAESIGQGIGLTKSNFCGII